MAASSGQQLELHREEARWNITSSTCQKEVDNAEISIATTPQEGIGQDGYFAMRATLKVTLLGDEWNSSAGGLSTINRELAIHLSKHPKVDVSLLVPEGACKDEEKRAAQSYGITVVDAKERPGYDPLEWLNFPPKDLSMAVVVGHGVKLGRQGQVIRDSPQFHNCKWVQVVHTAPEDLSKYKNYSDPISKGERKHQVEVDLCKLADLVVPVGPRLEEAYSSYLRCCKKNQDVFSITPGLFDREFGDLKQAPNENADFKVLIFGRGDEEDFELKGYNIAAEAFTDQRLKKKPYHLIFVGAPDGKQEEVREKLVQCGIAKEQLTVRKFIKSRDKMKDLLCEADLAIMPSKSEGFGLVALEALSAGLPILVGGKSGFAKALENVPFGKSCIVYSDDPLKWAKAIEAVRVRHRMRLKEITAVRASYEMTYCWKGQCEALVERMWRMVHGPSSENDNLPKVDSPAEQIADCRTSEQQPLPHDDEKRAPRTNKGAASSFNNGSQSLQNWCKPSISGSLIQGTVIRHSYQNLSDDKQKIVNEILKRQIHAYIQYHNVSTPDGVGALIEHIQKAYNLAVESVSVSSLVIKVQCPTLESLESLWNDCCSGHLNDVAEKYLVTDEIKRKLNLETVKLKTTIEEENYLICKKARMETSRLAVETIPRISAPDLLNGLPRLFGWVRKEDDSTRIIIPQGLLSVAKKLEGGWPWHYMILRTGCLYLFKKPDSPNFTEAIPLTKYRVCDASDISKYRWVFKLKWKDAIVNEKDDYTDNAGHNYCDIDDPSNDTPFFGEPLPSTPPPPSSRKLPERPPAPLPAPPLTPARRMHSRSLPPEPLAQYNQSSNSPLPPPRWPINPEKKPATLPRPLPAAPENPRRDPSPKPPTNNRLRRMSSESGSGPDGFGNVVKQLESTRLSHFRERDTVPPASLQPSPRPAAWRSNAPGRCPPDGCENSKAKLSEVSEAFQKDKTKESASRALQSEPPGTYLTRPGNSEAGKSLSLRDKNEDGTPLIRHYRILYTEGLGYALDTKGPRFNSISRMLQHYYHHKLPNTETKLRHPYQR